jgi:hypothetical protein
MGGVYHPVNSGSRGAAAHSLSTKFATASTITVMDTALAIGVRFVETLFFVGLAGSSVVVLLSFVEDFSQLFSQEDEK